MATIYLTAEFPLTAAERAVARLTPADDAEIMRYEEVLKWVSVHGTTQFERLRAWSRGIAQTAFQARVRASEAAHRGRLGRPDITPVYHNIEETNILRNVAFAKLRLRECVTLRPTPGRRAQDLLRDDLEHFDLLRGATLARYRESYAR